MDRGFNFKLLVPPRVSHGQVSAVRPQEIVDNCGDFLGSVQQGFTKCYDKEQNMPLSNKSVVVTAKPNRQDGVKMKVVSPMGKDESNNSGQLYTKLFDEVEKIKCWKVKIDSDTVQKERKLYENKRTIETQRKAIQELQFGNESLSIKLEEQICENEELRNRNNATRNLCNILKDTFERTAEKMHLFECEREETHHVLMDYHKSIQKQTEAFDTLHSKAEADQKELQIAKAELVQIEDLKNKLQQEYNMKEEEVEVLQTKLRDSENKIENILLELKESKHCCLELQGEREQKIELLSSSNAECDSLRTKLGDTEQRCKESESKQEAMAALLAECKQEYADMIQTKDFSLQELTKEKDLQTEKLCEMEMTMDQLQKSLAAETQRAKDLGDKVTVNTEELERTKNKLGEMTELSAKKDEQIQTLKEKLDTASKSMESINSKMALINNRVKELTTEVLIKTEEAQQLKDANENAGKALDELNANSVTAQIQVQELQQHLINEKKKNGENTVMLEELQKNITQQTCEYQKLLCDFTELQSVKSALEQKLESRSVDAQTFDENIKMNEEKTLKLTKEMEKVENENQQLRQGLGSLKTAIHQKCQEIEFLQKNVEKNDGHLQDEITKKERRIKVIEAKNKSLKKQMAKDTAKSSELQDTITTLQEETQNLKRLHEEERQNLLEDLKNKSMMTRELENEVQKLRSESEEAVKSKEEAELKCQNKISDMVTLMEKHKSQYDRMVQEKDAELEENKEKNVKAVAFGKSLKQELSKQKKENDSLKKQINEHVKEKENLQKELTDMKKETNISHILQDNNKQAPTINHKKKEEDLKTPNESILKLYRFDFSKARKTPVSARDEWSAVVGKTSTPASETPSVRTSCRTTPKSMTVQSDNSKTPQTVSSRSVSKIKSYRIRTPPSTEKKSSWEKGTIQLDPKSDSSCHGDLLMFSASQTKRSQSPASIKSPRNNLKLAAMKRMRDAGWTAVTGTDKKKRTNEKIFA